MLNKDKKLEHGFSSTMDLQRCVRMRTYTILKHSLFHVLKTHGFLFKKIIYILFIFVYTLIYIYLYITCVNVNIIFYKYYCITPHQSVTWFHRKPTQAAQAVLILYISIYRTVKREKSRIALNLK
jgi:hypothetical protein